MTASASLRQRFLSAGLWALVARVLAALAGFATNLLIVRLLPPADVGFYFLLVSAVTLAATLAQGGLQVAVVRLVAAAVARGEPGTARGVIVRSLQVAAMAAATLALVALLAGPWLFRRWVGIDLGHGILLLACAWLLALTVANLVAECMRGLHEYRQASLMSTTLPNVIAVASLGALLALSLPVDLEVVAAVGATAVAVAAGYALVALRRRVASLGTAVAARARDLLVVGWPLVVTAMALFVTTQIDLWIVGARCGTYDVAIYGASARLIAMVVMPMLVANTVLQPLVADLHGRGDTARLEGLVRGTAAATAAVAVPVVLLLFAAAEPILALAYGEYYRNGATVLSLLSAGQAVNVLAGPGAVVLMMTGGEREVMLVSIACGVFLAVAGYLAAGSYGSVGVAAVTAITNGMHGILCLLVVRNRLGIRVHASFHHLVRTVSRIRTATS